MKPDDLLHLFRWINKTIRNNPEGEQARVLELIVRFVDEYPDMVSRHSWRGILRMAEIKSSWK